jgi:hypothetical protein
VLTIGWPLARWRGRPPRHLLDLGRHNGTNDDLWRFI